MIFTNISNFFPVKMECLEQLVGLTIKDIVNFFFDPGSGSGPSCARRQDLIVSVPVVECCSACSNSPRDL